jgi:osmotically-inducible protein OsmY
MYEHRGTTDRYDIGRQVSGGSHFSSDRDRRGQFGPSFNRNTEGSSRWEQERDWGQHSAQRFRGKGPKGYQRSDERIREDINDRLSDSDDIDATEIELTVQNGEVTLTGTVAYRTEKRIAEDIADSVSGVKNVENRIRLGQQNPTESESGRSTSSRGGSNGSKTKHTNMSES